MDARNEQFATELYASFKVEAVEHLKGISDGLLALEGKLSPAARTETIEKVFRDAHSLKGAARAVNKTDMQDICQSLENVLSDLRNGVKEFTPADFDTLHSTVDLLSTLLDDSGTEIPETKKKLENLTGKLDAIKADGFLPTPEETKQSLSEATPYGSVSSVPTIRVRMDKLDKLMQQVEELTILKLITAQRHRTLSDLTKKLYTWKKRWGQMQEELRKLRQKYEGNRDAYIPSKDFLSFLEEQLSLTEEFEDKLLKQSKYTGQDARLALTMVDTLLEDTKTVLMLPFSSVFELFPRVVRDISRTLNKDVSLIISGGDVEVDRKILEEMKDPLIHLIRNCVDHGIETPEIREANGKEPQGRLIISAIQSGGNRVEITLCDDGAGINIDAVKKSAISQGVVSASEAERMSEDEIVKLIFKSGLSTNSIITEFSGRGVGMNVVMDKVEKLNGTIQIKTRKNVGTTFIITLPLTIATFRGVYIQSGGADYVFPTQYLVRVLRIKPDEIRMIEGKSSITLQGHHYAYVHLNDLLGKGPIEEAASKYKYLLLIKVTETLFAVGVDRVLLEQEILIKGLGNQLKKVHYIAGVTITDEGKVVPILDPFDLRNSLQNFSSSHKELKKNKTGEKKQYSIMIAEDSSTARMLLKNILESAGYLVKTAFNGAEAFAALKTAKVDLLVSDVDMPRMDGFELTQRLRALDQFKNLPIILCTSRGSQEDKEHGIEVGANAYIDKNSFEQGHLLDIISKLL